MRKLREANKIPAEGGSSLGSCSSLRSRDRPTTGSAIGTELKMENARLKNLLAEAELDKAIPKVVAAGELVQPGFGAVA